MNRSLIPIACVAVVVACQGNPPAIVKQSPVSSASVVASASPVADLPLTRVAFSCRLPVVDYRSSSGLTALQGGFITFPQAMYAADQAGAINADSATGNLVTAATPVLYGSGAQAFYNTAMNRWVPVGRGQASPDGKLYTYVTSGTEIHIVSVADGSERVLHVDTNPEVGQWQIGDFDGRIVYLLGVKYPREVWHLDPSTGSLERYMDYGDDVSLFQGGQAWAGRNRASGTSSEPYDTLVRVKAQPYDRTEWIYRPGQGIHLLGLDANNHPIVSIAAGPDFDYAHGDIRLIASPDSAGVEISKSVFVSSPQPDIGRIWFANDRGIYLFTVNDGLRKVFAFHGDPKLGESLTPAGYCR